MNAGDISFQAPWNKYRSFSGGNGGSVWVGNFQQVGGGVTNSINNVGHAAFIMFGRNTLNSTAPVNDGQWHHLVAVYDQQRQTQEFFVNGNRAGSASVPIPPTPSSEDFLIGGNTSSTGVDRGNFRGLIDEVQIYRRALSSDEVEFIHRSPELSAGAVRNPGNLDYNFDPSAGFANVGSNPVEVSRIVPLPNGRMLVGGSFASYGGISTPNFARINANGSLDPTFLHGFGASAKVNDFILQPDGRIVVVGQFDAFHELVLPGIARILADGRPDPSFLPGSGVGINGVVHAVDLQSDGRILVGGAFSGFDGTNRAGIARVNTDGSLDTTFDPGTGISGTVYELEVLTSGQILVAGEFTSVNGSALNGMARLNSDGSVDTAFSSPFETTAKVTEFIVRPNGQLLASGGFNLLGANGRRNVVRLNADGSLDGTFGSNGLTAGPDGTVNAMALCGDGSLLVGGDFTTYDGQSRIRLAKLLTNGIVDNTALNLLSPFQVTNNVVVTNFAPVFQTNFPPSTNQLFGFISNAVFVTLSTNTAPTSNQVSIVTTNANVTTHAAVTGQNPDANFFGLLGGANARVDEIVINSLDVPFIGGAFTNINGISRSGLAKLSPCSSGGGGIRIDAVVVDATTGQGVGGFVVSTPAEVTTSANDGTFVLLNTRVGLNQISVTKNGFVARSHGVSISSNTTSTNFRFVASPVITDTNSVRVVMTWGANPTDMDLWLTTPPVSTGAPPVIVNRNLTGSLTSSPFAAMDVSDLFSFGPETITITNLLPGIYQVAVNDRTGSEQLTNSQGLVELYTSKGLVTSVNIPSGQGGAGDWWDVAQINGSNGTYAVINNISNAQPTIDTNLTYNSSFGSGFNAALGAPTIVDQPENAYAVNGGMTILSVNASGTIPLRYQWYRNGVAVVGQTTASLPLAPLTTANSGFYHVVITNALGVVTSRVAQVSALSSTTPFVFVQPVDRVTDEGGATSFEVLAGGQRPLFYQWRHNGTNVPDGKSPLLTLTNVQPEKTGDYDIIVANSHGIVFSQSANLTVSTPPTITGFSVTPGTNVAAGDLVTLGVGVEGKPPYNFAWTLNGQVLPSALSSNLTIQQVHFTNAGAYQVIVTNVLGAASNTPVTLTVNSKPLLVMEPQNQFQTVGQPVTLNVGAIGSLPISYQWRLDGSDIVGATSSNLVFTGIQSSNVGNYTVVLVNQFGTNVSRIARVDVVLERAVLPWLQSFGGPGSDVGHAIGTDGAGNVYTVGKFAGTAQFGTNSLASAGVDDIFITKMDVNGNVLWAKRFGGSGYDVANDVVVLPSGDVLITGGFQGIADFGGTSVTNTTVASFSDIFVARLDPAGNVTWVRTEGVQFFSDVGRSLAVDGSTNVYVVGSSPLTSFNGAAISNVGRVLLAKYDGSGGRVWARKSGAGNGGSQDTGLGVSVAADGSVYAVGVFHSATYTNAAMVLTNRGFADGFAAKYDSAGALVWLRQVGANGMDSSEAVVATVNGDVLVAGQLSATNTIGTNIVVSRGGVLPDAFVINYDAAGNVQWVRAFGGTGSDAALDIDADTRGNIYLTGFFQGAATFGAKSVISIAATKDVFVAGVRPNGTVEFVQQAGGDSIAGESGLGVAVDVNGGGVFTGQYQGTFVAGGDSKTSTGANNVFVSRLVSPAPTMAAAPSTNGVVTFAWSSFRAGFVLESNGAELNSTNWSTIPITPSVVDGRFEFSTNTTSTNVLFLRLRQP